MTRIRHIQCPVHYISSLLVLNVLRWVMLHPKLSTNTLHPYLELVLLVLPERALEAML